jgi:hypothetical protein
MIITDFPIFKHHTEVSCCNCGGDLGVWWFKSGFPQGRGEFVQCCEKCRCDTHYDLEKADDGLDCPAP